MQNLDSFFKSLSNIMTFDMFTKILLAYFFIVWICLIVWVIKDITNRTTSLSLQLLSLFIIVFFTPFGIFLYLIIQPSKTLLEKNFKQIEDSTSLISAMLNNNLELYNCPKCNYLVSEDFKVCPSCGTKLKEICPHCESLVDPDWKICPFCGKKLKEEKKDDKDKKIEKDDKHDKKDFIKKEVAKKEKEE